MVCSNHMTMQDDVNQVVIHELIHAYDDCRAANLDWSNCAHHACSEVGIPRFRQVLTMIKPCFLRYCLFVQIRAGHLSGDCHYKRELLRGYVRLRGHEQVSFLYPCSSDETHHYRLIEFGQSKGAENRN